MRTPTSYAPLGPCVLRTPRSLYLFRCYRSSRNKDKNLSKTINERKDEQKHSMCLPTRIPSRYLAAFFDCNIHTKFARPEDHSVLESVDWPTRSLIKAVVQGQSTFSARLQRSHGGNGHSQLADGVVSALFALSRWRLSAQPAWLQQPPERGYGKAQKRKPTVRFPSTYIFPKLSSAGIACGGYSHTRIPVGHIDMPPQS